MNNIWHDINPERIKSQDFIAVVEISKEVKKYELDKETSLLFWIRSYILQHTIPLIMDLFLVPMEIKDPLMSWFYVLNQLNRYRWFRCYRLV